MKLLAALLLSSVLAAQQPNTTEAALTSVPDALPGVGPPLVVALPQNCSSVTLEVSGGHSQGPYFILAMPGAPMPGAFWTCYGLIDLNPMQSIVIAAGVLGSGSTIWTFLIDPATPIDVTLQAFVIDECECPSVAIYFYR